MALNAFCTQHLKSFKFHNMLNSTAVPHGLFQKGKVKETEPLSKPHAKLLSWDHRRVSAANSIFFVHDYIKQAMFSFVQETESTIKNQPRERRQSQKDKGQIRSVRPKWNYGYVLRTEHVNTNSDNPPFSVVWRKSFKQYDHSQHTGTFPSFTQKLSKRWH